MRQRFFREINNMDLSKHCLVCDNKLFDFKNGTRCSLTNERPNFKDKCRDINFAKNLEETIKEINTEYELVKKTKSISYANFVMFLLISAAVILTGFLIGKHALDKGVISTVPLIIMGVGISILPLASGPLNKYRQHISVAKQKKHQLDELLLKYNIKYLFFRF